MHKISALFGQDGAPIVSIDSRDRLCIVGIHQGGYNTVLHRDKYVISNVARLITPELIAILQKEAVKMDASLFNVSMKNRNLLRCRNILEANSIETNEMISSQYYKQGIKEDDDK